MIYLRANYRLLLLCIFSILFFFYVMCNTAIADTIVIDIDGGGDYASIQEAINNANESDILQINSGTYTENIIIDKSLSLIGSGSGNTIITGSGAHTIKITNTNLVTISSILIQNSGESYAPIFLSNTTDCIISNNIIKSGGNGLYLIKAHNNLIHDNTAIENNNIGLYLYNSDGNEIKGNNIHNNNVYGIYLLSSSTDNRIYLNDFSDNLEQNAKDEGGNQWYYNQQGNYWDDYDYYDINPEDGIGDKPYNITIDGAIKDNYPLGDFLSYDQQPIAYIDSISPNPSTEGNSISFQGHGTDDGVILEWEWKSSIDGVFGSSADCSSSGLSVGTHSITFRVKDDSQWSDYDSAALIIQSESSEPSEPTNQKPIAYISQLDPSTAFFGDEMMFSGYGTDSDGHIIQYQWRSSLIDGVLSSVSTFSTSNLSIGNHMIYFKVKDNEGAWSDEVSRELIIQGIISVDNILPFSKLYVPLIKQVNTPILFDASLSYDSDGNIESYQWNFGDNSTGTGKIISHSFSKTGNYTITLTVIDNDGGSSINSTVISIVDFPVSNNQNDPEQAQDENTTPSFELISCLLCFLIVFIFTRKLKYY